VAAIEEPTGPIPGATGFRARLLGHPWRAFLVLMALQPAGLALASVVVYGVFRLPRQMSDIEAFSTAALFTLNALIGYLTVPFLLRIPNGSRTFTGYLDDIHLTRLRPALPLLALTASCVLILMACQGSGSIVYRLAEGKPVTLVFLGKVFDLGAAVPPRSMLLFAQLFSSLEEVAFRGVLLTMLLRWYSTPKAITYSALAFGLMHLPSVFAGTPVVTALAQVVWAFLYGLFYGYIFVKTGSLLPSMIIHWLSNVFQDPLTAYWTTASLPVRALYGVVFGYGLAAVLSIWWVRAFTDRWFRSGGTGPGAGRVFAR
jgi:membrane protease YdiL (CAAX protease family)